MTRKLVAALACRNAGSRLYGKPLQNLDIESGTTILDHIVEHLRTIEIIDEIVLAISEGVGNDAFVEAADRLGLKYIRGDEDDVLARLIACGELAAATDIFRVTSESPFLYFEEVVNRWREYQEQNADALFLDEIVDGCGFEIISLEALKASHVLGEDRHRSELCTLYIRENASEFKVIRAKAPSQLDRKDLRLTVDYPEDLVLCRRVFERFKHQIPQVPVAQIIEYLDANPTLKELTAPYTEAGYETMNVWNNGYE